MTQQPSINIAVPGMRLSLRKNFTWTFAGNAIYAASQWGQLVVLAKLGTPETVGQFALALAICAPVIMFANLQLRSVQATDARHEYAFADYLGLRLMTTAVAYLVIIGIVMLSGYQWDTALAILFIGISKCFEAVSDVIFGLLQQRERMDRIAKSLMIEGPLTLGVMAVVLYMTHSIVWATGSLALVWGLQLAFYDIPSALMILRAQSPGDEWKLMRPRFDFKRIRPLVWLALPLGIMMLLLSLNTNIPRYFIEQISGAHGLGIFTALAYIMTAGSIVITALGQSSSPRLAKYFAAGQRNQFQALLLKLVGLGVFLGGIGVSIALVAGQPFLRLIYQPEYASYSEVFVWLTINAGITFVTSFGGYAITSAHYFKIQPIITAVSIILTIILCILLGPKYQLLGIVWAMTLAALCQMILVFLVIIHLMLNLKNKSEELLL